MPTKENGVNSSKSKEDSVKVMEKATDSEFIASVAINFSDVANTKLLLEETRLTKVEQKSTIVGSSVGIPEASFIYLKGSTH